MADNLFNSVKDLKTSTEENVLYGSLGIPLGGKKIVEVPNRSGFVYVRLRDSTSELIQAQNDQVSPIYGLPVILIRRGNKYYIKGRDTERYENWGTYSPFLPRHGDQHSFNPSAGMGGDVTFVYGNQFLPLLTTPSGSNGAGNAILSEYVYQQGITGWKYTGNTGTPDLLGYKPTGSSAVMVLVYLDTVSGNPGILVGSGSYFPNSITGTAQVVPYIPNVQSPNHIPSAVIRLSSGTTIIGWDNIYDAKQYYATIVTGTAGGGSLPLFTTGSVPYAGTDGILKENNTRFMFDDQYGVLWLGGKTDINIVRETHAILVRATGSNNNAGMGVITAGTGTNGTPAPFYNAYRSRGTYEVPTPVQKDDILWSASATGFDGLTWNPVARYRMYANANWITGSNNETRHEWFVTPTGSATMRVGMQLFGDSLNLTNTGTYNVNGIPHTHINLTPISGWIEVTDTWTVQSQAYTNDPAAGASIVLNMTATAKFAVDDTVIVSSSAGAERALVTAVVLNTSITVDRLQLNHTTTTPLVIHTKVTTPSGADTLYAPGTKVRYKQGGGYKYAYVVDNTSTLVSLQAGDDYYLTNASITDIAYSFVEAPLDFPPIFSWTPFCTGFSVQPTATYKFKIRGGLLYISVSQTVSGTSNLTTFGIPPPFGFINIANGVAGMLLNGANNGVNLTAPGSVAIISNNNFRMDAVYGVANGWTNANGKRASFIQEMSYR